jgi:hypothetical protein
MLSRLAQSVGRLPSNDEANRMVAEPSSVTVRLVADVPPLPRAKTFRPVGIARLPNRAGGSVALPVEDTVQLAMPSLMTGVALARALSQSGAFAEDEGGTFLSGISEWGYWCGSYHSTGRARSYDRPTGCPLEQIVVFAAGRPVAANWR